MNRNTATKWTGFCILGVALLALSGCQGDIFGGLLNSLTSGLNNLVGGTDTSLDGSWALYGKSQATTGGSSASTGNWISANAYFQIANGQVTELVATGSSQTADSTVLLDNAQHTSSDGSTYQGSATLTKNGNNVTIKMTVSSTSASTSGQSGSSTTANVEWDLTGTFDGTNTITGTLTQTTDIMGQPTSSTGDVQLRRG